MKKITYYLIAFFFAAFSWQGMAQFSESFDTEIPATWTVIDVDGGNTWEYSTTNPHTGTGQVRVLYNSSAHDDYLISPSFTVTAGTSDRVSFYAGITTTWSETFDVMLSTSGGNTVADFDVTLASETAEDAAPNHGLYSYDLSNHIGQTVSIAIRATDTDRLNLYIDDFVVDTPPEYAPVATLAELRAGTIGEKYEFTGTGYATAARLSASGDGSIRVFGQDATAGMQFYAAAGVISATTINFGDGVTGVQGVLTEAYGNLVFVVEHDITFDGNQPVTPQVVTAQDYIDNREDYESELIQILNTTIDNPDSDATFVQEKSYDISDDSGSLVLGVIFPQLDGNIPAQANVTGIAVENNTAAVILPRGDTDVEEILCPDVMNILADNFMAPGNADLSWDATTDATGYNWEIQPQGTAQGDTAIVESGNVTTESATATTLVSGTDYTLYVQSDCGNGALGEWMSYDFTYYLPIPGETCDDPIVIDATALPYTTSDDTVNYGDDYENGDSTCSSYYLSGDDVVYSFTPTADGSFNIIMSNIGATYSAIHVMDACLTGTETCVGFVGNSSTDDRELNDLALEGGTEYFIVISTWATPQSTTYDLEITENSCTNATVTYTAVEDCTNSQFTVNIEITNMGTATAITISDDQGNASQPATATGIYNFGPYQNGTNVTYTVVDDNDATCSQDEIVSFTCPIPGETCDDPIVIDATALPYTTSDDTANYGDDYENADSTCSSLYLSGDDVVYSFTPTADGSFNIIMSNIGATYSAIYVMDACLTGAETCVGFVGNSSTDDRELNDLALEGGTEYFIVISTWATPQSTTYDLEITENTASVDDLMSVGFNYYPNPIEDTLTMTANENITSIAIFNMLGQQVKHVNPSSLNATIDMTSIANGTYFIKATVGEKVGTFKIIKK